MNERRPWWKLSWPAVVAGLVMLAAVAVKNLDGTHWIPYTNNRPTMPWTSTPPPNASKLYWRVLRGASGWPLAQLADDDIISVKHGLGFPVLAINMAAALVLTLGTMQSINRCQRQAIICCRVSLKGMLALTGLAATNVAMFTQSHDFLWTIKPLATGVLFVGIFLTCLAVIDWIGGLWSLATRRFAARSTQTE